MTEVSTALHRVEGMSCGHCAASVREEVAAVSGVEAVDVDLQGKRVEVNGSTFSDKQVRAAIEAAGYQVAGEA